MEHGKISSKQAFLLIVTFIIATPFLGFPALVAAQAGNDAWVSSLLSTALAIPLGLLTIKIVSLYPGKTFIEILEQIAGVLPGKILGIIYIIYFTHITSGMVTEYGGFMTDVFMPKTPIVVFFITGLIVGAYTINKGLEVLARANQIFFPWLLLSIFLIFLLVIPEMQLDRFLPVFDTSMIKIAKGVMSPLTWYGEILAFAMITPYLSSPKDITKIVYASIITLGMMFFLLITISLSVFGPAVASMLYPLLEVARVINIAKFIDRPEPLIMAIWVTGGILKITFFYYIIVLGTAQLIKLKDYRPLIVPMGVILLGFSTNFAPNSITAFEYIAYYWPFYGLMIFELGLPLALFIIAFIRGKGESAG